MNTITRNIVIGVIILVIIALLGYMVVQERNTTQVATSTATSTNQSSTSTGSVVTISPTSTTQVGGYTIRPITGSAAPNYKTPLTYSANVSTDEKAQDESQFAAVQTAIASNPASYPAWIELGILRESTGDYQGAAADWKYVTELYPKDPTAFANLGNLYANDLHQPQQGITYYKQAIKIDPTHEETFYDNLAQIYLAQGDKTDAKAILRQGITAQVVGYQNLQTELNSIQ
ncbi:MAG: tetratricopeptide repeat protein [Candidatus Pacebacteria bacterium]|nr:tetratricopeptide repeat protein [Candidatus Paceibacterota bacterium]